eukprot:CAMPEP_0204424742 /NCGR_PEP_ID=MMETSP0470-20130426/46776_1 /ASSEMBLY_ACC=CAM_ASM_000385 /TAXON_ID=2969 /ORGANISM="Oxyrrhis marina" /LENGTH=62 /DNA_ID=CAMNT_0051422281 /DNA_START=8 /DNA_END=192 /DNA_ORIENTATION=+
MATEASPDWRDFLETIIFILFLIGFAVAALNQMGKHVAFAAYPWEDDWRSRAAFRYPSLMTS